MIKLRDILNELEVNNPVSKFPNIGKFWYYKIKDKEDLIKTYNQLIRQGYKFPDHSGINTTIPIEVLNSLGYPLVIYCNQGENVWINNKDDNSPFPKNYILID